VDNSDTPGYGDRASAGVPSGLFPAGPPRPAYREPHPVRPWAVLVGLCAGAGWLVLFALLGENARAHAWWTVAAGAVAWLAAVALARHGDRGVAVGVVVAVAVAWATLAGTVAWRWSVTGAWPL
jgi:hypothetical protein